MALILALTAVVWMGVRLTTMEVAKREVQEPRFEEEVIPVVMELGLHRDGVMPVGPPQATRTP